MKKQNHHPLLSANTARSVVLTGDRNLGLALGTFIDISHRAEFSVLRIRAVISVQAHHVVEQTAKFYGKSSALFFENIAEMLHSAPTSGEVTKTLAAPTGRPSSETLLLHLGDGPTGHRIITISLLSEVASHC